MRRYLLTVVLVCGFPFIVDLPKVDRVYDPRCGRLFQRDSIGIWGDLTNVGNGYGYVGNNPVHNVDRNGRDAKTPEEVCKGKGVQDKQKPSNKKGRVFGVKMSTTDGKVNKTKAIAACNKSVCKTTPCSSGSGNICMVDTWSSTSEEKGQTDPKAPPPKGDTHKETGSCKCKCRPKGELGTDSTDKKDKVQGRVIGENEDMLVISENDGAFVTEPTGSAGPALEAFESSLQGFGLQGSEHSDQSFSDMGSVLIIGSQ